MFACPERSRRARHLAALLALAVFAAALTVYAATEEDLAKVKVGMSKAEVVQIMGKPNAEREEKAEDLCRVLVYRNVGRYRLVNIWLDCKDTVRAIDRAG